MRDCFLRKDYKNFWTSGPEARLQNDPDLEPQFSPGRADRTNLGDTLILLRFLAEEAGSDRGACKLEPAQKLPKPSKMIAHQSWRAGF